MSDGTDRFDPRRASGGLTSPASLPTTQSRVPHARGLFKVLLLSFPLLACSIAVSSRSHAQPIGNVPDLQGIKPPDPFLQPGLPLPPPRSPRDTAPDADAPADAPVPLGRGAKPLTEDDVYATYQRGYFVEAFALATEMAKRGTPEAMTLIGHLYEVGQGIRSDLGRAAQWFQLGADRGDREAQVALGLMYLNGEGVKADRARAHDLFAAAAAKDQPTALFNLAIMTISGTVGPPDIPAARQLMRRAAELGSVEAAYSYALMLDADNRPGQESEITYWMGLAANAGHVPAEVEYAIRLSKGRGATADLDTAVIFLNRAAWAGNPIAQNRLAHLIATGIGMPFDSIEAAKWHLLAKAGGVQDPQLEDLLASLKPEEVARARQLASEWPRILADPPPGHLQTVGSDPPKFELRGPLDFQRSR